MKLAMCLLLATMSIGARAEEPAATAKALVAMGNSEAWLVAPATTGGMFIMTPYGPCGSLTRVSRTLWGFSSGFAPGSDYYDNHVYTGSVLEAGAVGFKFCKVVSREMKASRETAKAIREGR